MTRPAYHAWYNTGRWRRLRQTILTEQPLCVMCIEQEYVEPATVVDHVIPHKGNEALFWDPANLQSLCKPCHDRDKKLIENGRTVVRFGPDGWPL